MIIIKKLTIIFFLFFYSSTYAATYYMGTDGSDSYNTTQAQVYATPWLTLQNAMSEMIAGDTLIIKDGTYTGSTNVVSTTYWPPNGNYGVDETDATDDDVWTTIKAEHDGKVLFGDPDSSDNTFYVENKGDSYIQFEGLVWLGGCHVGNVNYLKFLRCGSGSNIVNVTNLSFSNNVSDHILYEDCYAWGGSRYKFVAYLSDHIIFRRCVGRVDAANTTHDSKTEPIGGVSIYGSSYCEIQNCIIIDSQTSAYWVYESLPGAFTTPNTGGADNYFRGCIGLKIGMSLHGQHNAYTNTNRINCIGWDMTAGAINGGVTHFNHNTIGEMPSTVTGNTAGINGYSATVDVLNSLLYNIDTSYGAVYHVTSDYNYFYANTTNYVDTTPGAHDVTDVNPLTNSLLYLPRIESGSDLAGQASDSGDIGATIIKKIGVSGTLWGETGYATTTDEDLWPWPNEDIIKTNFSSYDNENVSGTRGFCAAGKQLNGTDDITLTSYIWEYLGNSIPFDIYGVTPNLTGLKSMTGGTIQ